MKTRETPTIYMHLVAVYKEMKDLAKKKGKNLQVEIVELISKFAFISVPS